MADIDTVLIEKRRFKPPAAFSKLARIGSLAAYRKLYAQAEKNPDRFWAERAAELRWTKKWKKVLDWAGRRLRSGSRGQLNASDCCLDRHVGAWRKNKAAIVWEGEPGDARV